MDQNARAVMEKRMAIVCSNLEKNNMQAFYVPSGEEALQLVQSMLREGETVATGGSMSLKECGIIDLLKSGKYTFLDRSDPDLSPEEKEEVTRKAFFADTYLCSSNAVTEAGELYNVDGNANRVAALAFGPKSVILVVGYNKVVCNLDEAINRVKAIACPANCQRIPCETYCREKGRCMSLGKEDPSMTDGCQSPARICSSYLVQAYQKQKNRIKVILVGEDLGY